MEIFRNSLSFLIICR